MLGPISIAKLVLLLLCPGIVVSWPAKPSLDSPEGAYGRRLGTLSNEALPPAEEDKLQEKQQRAWEKWKILKELPATTPATGPDPKGSRLKLDVEEFFVEHEISLPRAREAARVLNITTMPEATGCLECSQREMEYCTGLDVMSDHCCCDKKYTEAFPFVPHTCYIGAERCRPVATDCGEYVRLRNCCCDKYLAVKWKKNLFSAAEGIQPNRKLWILPWISAALIKLTLFS